jgi:four helix bundle protein
MRRPLGWLPIDGRCPRGFRKTGWYFVRFSVDEMNLDCLPTKVALIMKENDLEVRTEKFAAACRTLIRKVDKDITNIEDCKQLARSSASTAANCIEANEAFTKKDRKFRFKISRKEAKESRLFVNLLHTQTRELDAEKEHLSDEASQLVKIFSAIVLKIGDDQSPSDGH